MENQSTEIVPTGAGLPGPITSLPGVEEMQARMDHMIKLWAVRDNFIREFLKPGIDRGIIPGTEKETMYKPGAEKMLVWYGYYAHLTLTNDKEDFGAEIFAYVYRCEIRQIGTNIVVGVCEGDCSTRETKYGYRWVKAEDLPSGADFSVLTSRVKGNETQYRIISENPADKRNTARKMAQKRAFVGATLIACALSGVFGTDAGNDPDDDDIGGGNGEGAPKGDYGNPISQKQAGRLYKIRKDHNIDDGEFKRWLKAKYGYTDDRKIGWKVYDEICKACESGKLEMPASKPAADPTPAKETAQPTSGGRVGTGELANLNATLKEMGRSLADFEEWLGIAFPNTPNASDILAADYQKIKAAYKKDCEGGE